jgi:4-hydroxy-tetrahydrodipicolinate synthase
MNAVGNLAPQPLAALCEALWENDLRRARKIHEELFELNRAVFFDTNPIPIKYLMKRMGLLAEDEHRLPMTPPAPDVARRLDGVFERCGLGALSAAQIPA